MWLGDSIWVQSSPMSEQAVTARSGRLQYPERSTQSGTSRLLVT